LFSVDIFPGDRSALILFLEKWVDSRRLFGQTVTGQNAAGAPQVVTARLDFGSSIFQTTIVD
jgi:hypothetical protein